MHSDDDDWIGRQAVFRALEHLKRKPDISREMVAIRDQIAVANSGGAPTVASDDAEVMKEGFRRIVAKTYSGRGASTVFDELKEAVGDAGIPIQINGERMVFFRARKQIDSGVEDIAAHSTFSAPPPEFTGLGRANLEKHPVLYCACSTMTAFSEISTQPNDRVHLAIYEKPAKIPISIALFLFDGISPQHPFSLWAKRAQEHADSQQALSGARREAVSFARRLLSRLFLSDNYTASARIAHSLLYEDSINSIFYPSVANNSDCSLALQTGYAHRNLRLWRVYEVTVSASFDRHRFHRMGIPNRGSVVWGPCSGRDHDELQKFVTLR